MVCNDQQKLTATSVRCHNNTIIILTLSPPTSLNLPSLLLFSSIMSYTSISFFLFFFDENANRISILYKTYSRYFQMNMQPLG